MPIEATCQCGARFRLPDSAAGKRARCKRCGASVTIPSRDLYAISEPERSADDSETRLAPPPLPVTSPHHPDDTATTNPRSGQSGPGLRAAALDELSRERTFRQDLLDSLVFYLDPANIVTIGVLAFVVAVIGPFAAFIPVIGVYVSFSIIGYFCAFCFGVIVDTAAGEDELSTVGVDDVWDDLVWPLFRFAGSWLFLWLPAIALRSLSAADLVAVPDAAVATLFVVGTFFWPAFVLMVAINGGFAGIWPQTVVRTVLAAPGAYLASWGVLLMAGMAWWVPNSEEFTFFVSNASPRALIVLDLVSTVVGVVASVVAMRVIGLFYRHFKHRFPWVAE